MVPDQTEVGANVPQARVDVLATGIVPLPLENDADVGQLPSRLRAHLQYFDELDVRSS